MKTTFLIAALLAGATLTAAAQDSKVKVKTKQDGVTTTEVQETDHDKRLGRETTKTTTRTTTQTTPEVVEDAKDGGSKVGHGAKQGAKKTGHVAKKGASKVGHGTKRGAKKVVKHTPGTDANKEHKEEKREEKMQE